MSYHKRCSSSGYLVVGRMATVLFELVVENVSGQGNRTFKRYIYILAFTDKSTRRKLRLFKEVEIWRKIRFAEWK
jgi:hypothetical protein